MKKIGLNLLWMVPGKVGGSETYTTRLLHGLAERSSELDYTIFALPQFAQAHPELASTFKTALAPVSGSIKSFRIAGENSWLATQCRIRKIDLVHHAGGTVPLVRAARPVLTIHDLQYLYYPEYFTRTKLTYLRTMVPRSAEVARIVLTPSEFTRRTVIERLNMDPSVVRVVPHGISLREAEQESVNVRERYELDGPFFLYPAITYPHKNHLVLVQAFASLLRRHPHAKLVLTGAKGSMETRISTEVRGLGIEKSVRRLGYIPAHDLNALYHEAVALTFPSRFEGFGAPVLEALARGCPAIAADVTALPEVVADAGVLLSPDNPEEWCEAMIAFIDDPGLAAGHAAAGRARAARFTWAVAADVLEDAYDHVLETLL